MTGKNKEHEYCLRCGRKLKTTRTRLLGYGEVCKKKMEVEQNCRLFPVKIK